VALAEQYLYLECKAKQPS